VKNETKDIAVIAKADTAVRWCQHASDYLLKHGGKQWKYLLVLHDDVGEHNTLSTYIKKYEKKITS